MGGGLHGATPAQQVYNTFHQGGMGFNGNQPLRGPPGQQNINPMGGLGPNNLDLRSANQAQLLGLPQGNLGGGGGGGMRSGGPGFGGPQHGGPVGQLPHLPMRQQQQPQQHLGPTMGPPPMPQGEIQWANVDINEMMRQGGAV